jgi:hypothetical protein
MQTGASQQAAADQSMQGGLGDMLEGWAVFGAEIDPTIRLLEEVSKRANRLADECGNLRHERDELLRENAILRRKLERAK